MTETSDPATELHKLCTILKTYEHKGHTHQALASVLGVEPQSSAYFETIGYLASRFGRLANVYEETLEEPARSLGVKTIQHLQQVFAANRQVMSWKDTKAQVFDQGCLQTLQMSAPFIRMSAPITIPTTEERRDAIVQIDAAIETLAEYHGAISSALLSSLRTIRRILERLDIYGVDVLTDQFLRAYAIRTAADRETEISAPERSARLSAWATIAFAASFFVASDSVLTSVENHYNRAERVVQILIQEVKLLPAPATEDPCEGRKVINSEPNARRGKKRSDIEDGT